MWYGRLLPKINPATYFDRTKNPGMRPGVVATLKLISVVTDKGCCPSTSGALPKIGPR